MLIHICDICKKEIDRGQGVSVDYDSKIIRYSFCEKCGKPVIEFLKKKKLTK